MDEDEFDRNILILVSSCKDVNPSDCSGLADKVRHLRNEGCASIERLEEVIADGERAFERNPDDAEIKKELNYFKSIHAKDVIRIDILARCISILETRALEE